jgi:hypothetical protein
MVVVVQSRRWFEFREQLTAIGSPHCSDDERTVAKAYFERNFGYARPRLLALLERQSDSSQWVIGILGMTGLSFQSDNQMPDALAAVEAFELIGPAGIPAIPELKSLLSSERAGYLAVVILANMDEPGERALSEAAKSTDARMRGRIAGGLRLSPRPTPGKLACLDSLLRDATDDVAGTAAVALATLRRPSTEQFDLIVEFALRDIEEAMSKEAFQPESWSVEALRNRAGECLEVFESLDSVSNAQNRRVVDCLLADMKRVVEWRQVEQNHRYSFSGHVSSVVECAQLTGD